MKENEVIVYVEGKSDILAMEALLSPLLVFSQIWSIFGQFSSFFGKVTLVAVHQVLTAFCSTFYQAGDYKNQSRISTIKKGC